MLEANKNDLTALRAEFKSAVAQQGDTEKEISSLRRQNEELSAQNKMLHGVLERIREEKYELEEKIAKLSGKDREIRYYELCLLFLNEKNSRIHETYRKEKVNERDYDRVSHFKHEINARENELNQMKRELQNSHQKTERLTIELEKLRSTHKSPEGNKIDLERIAVINQGLSNEMETMKRNVSSMTLFIGVNIGFFSVET